MTTAELFEMLLTEPEETIRQAIQEAPAVLDIRTDKGLSPMAWAWWNGRPEVAQMLIDAGADLDFYDTVYMGSAAQLEELLPRTLHLVNSFSPLGLPPLMLAIPDPATRAGRSARINQLFVESMAGEANRWAKQACQLPVQRIDLDSVYGERPVCGFKTTGLCRLSPRGNR